MERWLTQWGGDPPFLLGPNHDRSFPRDGHGGGFPGGPVGRGSHLIHEDVKDTGGDRQREGGEEECEEPGRGIHGRVEALRAEVGVQVRELFLQGLGCGEAVLL